MVTIFRWIGKTILASSSKAAAKHLAETLSARVGEMRFYAPDYIGAILKVGGEEYEVRFLVIKQYMYQVVDILAPGPALPQRPPVRRLASNGAGQSREG